MKNWHNLRRVGLIISVSIVLIVLGCLTLVMVNQAHAKEKILVKDVPYVHQRWRLD